MAISATSKNPDKALQFLNLLNTDPVVMTYVNYGVEGFTYNKNDDGTITFIDDARATYSPWTNGVGNVRILPPTSDQGADFWQRFSAYYDAAETPSPTAASSSTPLSARRKQPLWPTSGPSTPSTS